MKDVITAQDVSKDLWLNYEQGLDMGATSHYTSLDKHFRWLKHDVITLAGIGNFGKSQMLLQLLTNKVVFDGWRVAMFSPENSPPVYFYSDIIHTYAGKATQRKYRNYISQPQFAKAIDWVAERFFYIYPENDSPTPEYVNERFEEIIKKKRLDCVIVDPFGCLVNALEKTYGREDRYIEWYLQTCKRFAQKHDLNYVTVTHPNSTVEREKDGNYKFIDAFHLKGGITWNKLFRYSYGLPPSILCDPTREPYLCCQDPEGKEAKVVWYPRGIGVLL